MKRSGGACAGSARGIVLGAARLRDLRAARQPAALGGGRALVFPAQAAVRNTASSSGRGCSRRAATPGLARHQHLHRAADGRACPGDRDARRLCAGPPQACRSRGLMMLAFLLPQAFPNLPSTSTSPASSTDRPERHDARRRPGPYAARPGVVGVDRGGRLRRRRPLARGGRAQHGRRAVARVLHGVPAARGARHHGERDLRVSRVRWTSSPAPISSACPTSSPCRC